MIVRVKFEPRDMWVGVYWQPADGRFDTVHRVYVCLVPFFPIMFAWWKRGCEP